MMLANSFDLWQKDAFFSAAEEVQESADVMESAYRMWIREKREGSKLGDLDELSGVLQTALGTAKWQLEEFERAVRLSRGHCSDDITASRHKQFAAAIESQISRVEVALREALCEEGKQPFRWVNLDKEECDDLAMFLTGTPKTSLFQKDDRFALGPSTEGSFGESHHRRKDIDLNLHATCSTSTSDGKGVSDVSTSNKSIEFIIDIEEKDLPGVRDDIISQVDKTTGARRTWSSPNFGALKVVVADENEQRNKLLPHTEATPKEKGSKHWFWKQKFGENPQAKGTVNLLNQICGQVVVLQRSLQTPLHLQLSCSIQLTLAIMLCFFLIATTTEAFSKEERLQKDGCQQISLSPLFSRYELGVNFKLRDQN